MSNSVISGHSEDARSQARNGMHGRGEGITSGGPTPSETGENLASGKGKGREKTLPLPGEVVSRHDGLLTTERENPFSEARSGRSDNLHRGNKRIENSIMPGPSSRIVRPLRPHKRYHTSISATDDASHSSRNQLVEEAVACGSTRSSIRSPVHATSSAIGESSTLSRRSKSSRVSAQPSNHHAAAQPLRSDVPRATLPTGRRTTRSASKQSAHDAPEADLKRKTSRSPQNGDRSKRKR
ncbi:hypothetical protein L218DRAFT_958762 [Marasmius fiardii PR-910]|nr:hypothetical protein L218DRAFT_958762 [Marasmius fiardii PR-910]